MKKTAAENPQFPHPQWFLGTSYEAIGDAEKAFAANVKALEIEGDADLAAQLQKMKSTQGVEAANRLWFEEFVKARTREKIPAIFIALRAATVKDREQTIYWLEKSLEEGNITLGGIKFLAKFDFVRDDPRFQAITQKVIF